MKTFFSCYFIMATRKYKKQKKGNLKKKSLGKKKRSMKKRGKSLKKRGGNGDLLIKPLANGDILPWAKYVNPLYIYLKQYGKLKNNFLQETIPEMYKNRINQIYNRNDGKSLIYNFERLTGSSRNALNSLSLKSCIILDFSKDERYFYTLICQAIKIRIYYDIIRQIQEIVNIHTNAKKKISELKKEIELEDDNEKVVSKTEEINNLKEYHKNEVESYFYIIRSNNKNEYVVSENDDNNYNFKNLLNGITQKYDKHKKKFNDLTDSPVGEFKKKLREDIINRLQNTDLNFIDIYTQNPNIEGKNPIPPPPLVQSKKNK